MLLFVHGRCTTSGIILLCIRHITKGTFASHHIARSTSTQSSATQSPASPTAVEQRIPWLDRPGNREPNVFPESLRDTLDALRDANRTSLITKYVPGTRTRKPLDLSEASTKEQPELGPSFRSLKHGLDIRKGGLKWPKFDYIAEDRPLNRLWATSPDLHPSDRFPWLRHISNRAKRENRLDGPERLTEEIVAFDEYLSPTIEESSAASAALDDITKRLETVHDNLRVSIVGSRCTGLATPFSDLDINVAIHKDEESGRAWQRPKELLSSLHWCLTTSTDTAEPSTAGLFQVKEFRRKAKVPVVCGVHVRTGLEFQLQSTTDVHLSLQYMKCLIEEYPTLPGLFKVLKHMLVMRGLWAGPYRGMTAYPLTIMIAAALRSCQGRFDRRAAGKHLLAFLDMYSEIDFYTTGLAFSPLRYMRKPGVALSEPVTQNVEIPVEGEWKPSFNQDRPYLMSLEDPANPGNDLGRTIWLIKHVQLTLINARQKLLAAMEAWEGLRDKEENTPLLACCVEGDYRIFQNERNDLRATCRVPQRL